MYFFTFSMHLTTSFKNKIMHFNLLPNHLPYIISLIFPVSGFISIFSQGKFFIFHKEKTPKETLNAWQHVPITKFHLYFRLSLRNYKIVTYFLVDLIFFNLVLWLRKNLYIMKSKQSVSLAMFLLPSWASIINITLTYGLCEVIFLRRLVCLKL